MVTSNQIMRTSIGTRIAGSHTNGTSDRMWRDVNRDTEWRSLEYISKCKVNRFELCGC
jgi:hypothetical protein